jgi:hypothetical protein
VNDRFSMPLPHHHAQRTVLQWHSIP